MTILEDHHSRDRTNTVLGRDARGFIRVELHLHRREFNQSPPSSVSRVSVRRAAFHSPSRRDAFRDASRVFRTHRLELALILLRELIDQRRDHAARTAPRRPKINQHGDVGFQHLALKRLVRHHRGERACLVDTGRVTWVDVSVEAASRVRSRSRSSDDTRRHARVTRHHARVSRLAPSPSTRDSFIHSFHSRAPPSARAIASVVASRPPPRAHPRARAKTPRRTRA